MRRLSIIVSVNHCAPNMGSEHGVGWNFVYHLSKFHDLHVICRKHEYIDSLIAFEQSEEGRRRNIRFYFIEQKVAYKGFTRFFPLSYYRDYNRWQKKVYTKAKELIDTEKIDLIHQITNITFREPGYLWKLNRPFVWGPVGVLGNDPVKFPAMYKGAERLKMVLRRITCLWQLRFNRRLRQAVQSSAACLPISKSVQSVLSSLGRSRFLVMPETGSTLLPDTIVTPSHRPEKKAIKLLWIGRFDYSKGIMFLLEALRIINNRIPYELIMAGDGVQRSEAVDYCRRHQLSYQYLGRIPHQEIEKLYHESHLFFLTSMMDATTSVLFESLQAGCPVVALNHLSFSEVIDSTCGIKIEVTTPRQIAEEMAEVILSIYKDESRRLQLAEGAVRKARQHSWENKTTQLNQLYKTLLIPEEAQLSRK